MKKPFHEWLLSPWVILPSMLAGVLIGIFNKELALFLAPFGDIYLKLLQMCVLPLIITAIVTSLGNMLQEGTALRYIKKLVVFFLAGLLICTTISILITLALKPGSHLSGEAKTILSRQISHNEQPLTDVQAYPRTEQEIVRFMQKMVPGNIFAALSNGENLAILFFSVLLGIGVGSVSKSFAETTLIVFDAIYLAFLKIISWIMYGLPLGLCFLFAGDIAQLGLGILFALGKIIVLILCLAFAAILSYALLIWYKTRASFSTILHTFKTPLLIAFSTSSSFATLPTLLASLQKNLKLDKSITDLVIPLGISLNEQGTALHFAAAAIFIAQLYGIHLTFGNLIFVLFTSIFASIATSGIPVIAAVSVFAMVLEPIGLPTAVGIILLTAIEPLVDPFLTVVSVMANAAAAVFVASNHHDPVIEKT